MGKRFWTKTPFIAGTKVGDANFATWYMETNLVRPKVRCRVCGKITQSEPAAGNRNIPCTNFHKNAGTAKERGYCWGSGMPGIVIRKSGITVK